VATIATEYRAESPIIFQPFAELDHKFRHLCVLGLFRRQLALQPSSFY
jgi:hypothetical protein